MSNKPYKILNQKELEDNKVEIEAEISKEAVNSFREASVKELGADLEFPGFRKGTAPEKMVVEAVGEFKVLEKSAYKALNNIVPMIFAEEKINSLTTPQINITKLSEGSDVEVKMTFEKMPEVTLPDYKKIAKEVEQTKEQKVEDKEVEEYIKYLQQQRAQAEKLNPEKRENKEGDKKEDNKEEEVLEIDDAFVKTLGDFKDVDDFKKQLKENLKKGQKRRLAIMEKIIEEVDATPPQILVDQELERMLGQFKQDIERFKMSPEDYMKEIKKTEDDLKKEWEVDAKKRVKMNMILPKIAAEEKLKANQEAVEKEVKHLQEHYPDVNEEHAKLYVENILINEEVFKFLEGIK
jgi:FKBP-type peptidyl-prolyl cis-trans isomerase (trigger factor)